MVLISLGGGKDKPKDKAAEETGLVEVPDKTKDLDTETQYYRFLAIGLAILEGIFFSIRTADMQKS